jgi:hypothetical protein
VVDARRLQRPWEAQRRLEFAEEDRLLAERNAAAAIEGKPLEYFYRSLYCPEEGMFRVAPPDLGLGTRQTVRVVPRPALLGRALKAGVQSDGQSRLDAAAAAVAAAEPQESRPDGRGRRGERRRTQPCSRCVFVSFLKL